MAGAPLMVPVDKFGADDGEAALSVFVLAFGTAADALARYGAGDAVSVSGRFGWRGTRLVTARRVRAGSASLMPSCRAGAFDLAVAEGGRRANRGCPRVHRRSVTATRSTIRFRSEGSTDEPAQSDQREMQGLLPR